MYRHALIKQKAIPLATIQALRVQIFSIQSNLIAINIIVEYYAIIEIRFVS